MAQPFNKHFIFLADVMGKVHDLFGTAGSGADTCKIYLAAGLPDAENDAVKTDNTEFTGGNNYVTGGASIANVGTRSGNTFSLAGTDVVWSNIEASPWNAFQYVELYNDTAATDPLIAWWAYTGSLALGVGETFTVDFAAGAAGVFTFA